MQLSLTEVLDFTDPATGEEHKVTVNFRRLKRQQFAALSPHLPKPDDSGNVRMDLTDNLNLMEQVAPVMRDCVSGVRSETLRVDGREITLDDIIDETVFMGLFGGTFQAIMKHSVVQPKQEKNSGASSGVGSKESEQTTQK